MFMFESQLVQMPVPRDIILYWPGPRAFSVLQKLRGWAYISVQKPRGARGMVTGQIDTCITLEFLTWWYFFDTIAEFTLQFLTCYFFDMLFLYPISVNPLFV